jgi:hypothetical protein
MKRVSEVNFKLKVNSLPEESRKFKVTSSLLFLKLFSSKSFLGTLERTSFELCSIEKENGFSKNLISY